MQALQVVRHGTPSEAVEMREVDVPTPGAGEVLVRVHATALNFPDVLLAAGRYQVRPELPFTLGIEMCGTVVAAGDGGEEGLVGRRVVGMSSLPHGALAEYAIAPAGMVVEAPAGLDDAEAASFYVAYQTGWFGLHHRARLREGETLLVHAAAGGVGSAAVQLGKAAGARVVAVVGGEAKAEVARGLGADDVVDRTAGDLVTSLKAVIGHGGADVVYDPVGGESFVASTKVIAFDGRIVVVGFTSGEFAQAATNHLLVKGYGVLGLHWGRYQELAPQLVREAHAELSALADSGAVRPLVSRRLALVDAVDGLTDLAAGRTTGRVVVEVGDG
ncbi:MAG TPA: NADPH:quinone oxidoreductase family protein [Actinomycetales bacterium]|nr:NADPH:quinone oxidoreductase family protein [Actinomycetales bacterium]